MANRYRFPASCVPYAWVVADASTGRQVPGSVTRSISGAFTYQRGRWDGVRQVFDSFSASTLDELSAMIDQYLSQEVV